MKTESVGPRAKYRNTPGRGRGLRSGEEERECQGGAPSQFEYSKHLLKDKKSKTCGSQGKNILERAFRSLNNKQEGFILTAMETMDFNARVQTHIFWFIKDHFHSSM